MTDHAADCTCADCWYLRSSVVTHEERIARAYDEESTDPGVYTPGTPLCEHLGDIARALKTIEAERLRAAQASNLPEES